MNKNLIISGGGTGGHIYPAISIANQLKKKVADCNILFVGAKNKMEMKKVPENGYKIIGLWISGYQRKFNFISNLKLPFKLIYSLIHSLIIILKYKPKVVVGTGGVIVSLDTLITGNVVPSTTIPELLSPASA